MGPSSSLPTASPRDPSPREECGGGCCVSACLSAHPRRAAFPPSPSSQPCDRTICKLHTSHAWQLGRARATSTVSYTLPAYNYKYGTTIRHGTRSAVSSGVASMTDRLRPKPSANIDPDRVSVNRTHSLAGWTYVTACKCGVHATQEGSVRSGRHLPHDRARSAPFRRPPLTARQCRARAAHGAYM
jgi:hypothetical protein